MSYEIAVINPRRRRSKKRPSKAQLRARARFVARFGKGKKARKARRRRKSSPNYQGVSVMAKRRKRRSTKGRFKKATHVTRRRRRRSSGKRRTAVGYVVGNRPIRRRKMNPRARRRRYRRNPLGLPSMGGFIKDVQCAGIGALGAAALTVGLSFIPLPAALNTGYVRQGVRLVAAFGGGFLLSKFFGKKPWVRDATVGAMTVVLYDTVRSLAQAASPEIGARLGEFEDVSLDGDLDGEEGFYDPAPVIAEGTGAYLEGPGADDYGDGAADSDMGAYMEGNLDGMYVG